MVSCSPSWRRCSDRLNRPPLLDTPDAGLNQAFAWAIRHGSGGVRADPSPGLVDWDGFELTDLLERAAAFRRVGSAGLPDPADLVRGVTAGLFGARADAEGGRFAVAPWLPDGWRWFALRRLRCHRTLVDVEVRPRAEWATVRLTVTFGPPIAVALTLRNAGEVARVTVDEVALEGQRAVFTAAAEHEAMFFYRGARA